MACDISTLPVVPQFFTVKAQYNLGIMYARGDGVERDRHKSLFWITKSARQGNQRALKCLRMRLEQSNNAGHTAEGAQKGT